MSAKRSRGGGNAWTAGLLVLWVAQAGALAAQTTYVPRGNGADDGPHIQRLLDQGHRYIQFAGDLVVNTPIILANDAGAYHHLRMEPTPNLTRVRIQTAIGRDDQQPSNPARAVFEYGGAFRPGSWLANPTLIGDTIIRVQDPSAFSVGADIFLSDTSSYPGELPVDGACEVRRVVGIEGEALTLDRPLRRQHAAQVVVALVTPIMGPVFRGLSFSGDAHVGIHLTAALEARIEGLQSVNWRGGMLVLLDLGGRRNVIVDSYATGTEPGYITPGTNTWGIAVEGQEDTTILNSGASRAEVGVLINYSVDTWAYATNASRNVTNVMVGTDWRGNGSIRSGFRSGQSRAALARGAIVDRNCLGCEISVDLIENEGYDVELLPGADRTRIGFGNYVDRVRSICGVLVRPNPKGTAREALVDLRFSRCDSKTNICNISASTASAVSVTLGGFSRTCVSAGTSTASRPRAPAFAARSPGRSRTRSEQR